ncbi:hypothetical protein [Actinomadura sp.]|uniref:hypothetical protein n=2 Tax=Actinomadura sp. TaxID=1989 RepID=UPI003352DA32
MKLLGQFWGYLLLIVLALAWWKGGVAPVILIVLSVAAVFYFFFRAPVWCGAMTRENRLCRKNANGILMGCSYRHHKWQKIKLVFFPRAWAELNRGLWATPREGMTTLAGLAGVVSSLAAVATLVMKSSGKG